MTPGDNTPRELEVTDKTHLDDQTSFLPDEVHTKLSRIVSSADL